ncbi:hypothetical protein CDD82_340 [Ophiocordyceps australis]|uniref:Uncharacterized protein n=1 Tax=Ophiocordyceps australis TaxID=1399860 RepID=A0A2C5XDR2_9HYPO|nr:hypothetical protein CDD82_340 [Ophiocordyceps australis]
MDGFNECRSARVFEILMVDFRVLQHHIASAPSHPQNTDEHNCEAWTALRQCASDGYYILECASSMKFPVAQGGNEEQSKAALRQNLLDAFSRRHEAQKIYAKQCVAKKWVEARRNILKGRRPHSSIQPQLQAYDAQLRAELAAVTDEYVYNVLASLDQSKGRWTVEDPSLHSVKRWLRQQGRR